MAGVKFRMEAFGKGIVLPFRGCNPSINRFQIGKVHRVARVHNIGRVFGRRIFRIKANAAALIEKEIFKISNDRACGPNLTHKGQLTPTNMSQDDVGCEPFGLYRLHRNGRAIAIATTLFPIFTEGIGTVRGSVMGWIADNLDPIARRNALSLGQKHNFMPTLCNQPRQYFSILTGIILVNHQNFHMRLTPFAA